MKLALGTICMVVTVVVVLLNGALMTASPRLWFRLPAWVRCSGSLDKAKFTQGKGAAAIRILGLCFLALMAWFFHGVVTGHW